ncbi:lytic transglycosylase domain-containing protein [Marinobacter zhejiangensis]|uniref:Transglycosylase SLT domain-containing protein n=1 Tax=Marinobacter zhejiangensis TaxID=488535 RepID=A0A1I4Q514_9GAMM|nr:lytic transglycosylase domain-containing protein [Marinobacter zhejiangensis]SFM34723.1 Transglycosylase SLT domain-containing protein [Marinobacter zhejiangensis]
MTLGRTPLFTLLTILMTAVATSTQADSIRRIVHPDGSVEFTNVTGDPQVRASTGNDTVYRYEDNHGVVAYSSNRPTDSSYDVIRFHCFACNPASTVNWLTTPLFRSPYQSEIQTAAREYDVDPALVRAVIHAESAFNSQAVSPKGAQGLMQLMPGTARELDVSNALDAAENIRGGVLYLARMLDRFDNDVTLATAAYNAGPGAVDRFDGIPPYAETQAYVERVGILHRRYGER